MIDTKKLIFIVEKDPDLKEIYNLQFTKSGFEVELASTNEEAFSKIQDIEDNKQKPDAIILDLNLKAVVYQEITNIDMNVGIKEIFEKLKSIQAGKNIPLFILSIYPMSSLDSPDAFADIKPERFIDISSATPTKVAQVVKDELGIK